MPPIHPDLIVNIARLGLISFLLAVVIVVAARFRQFWGITPLAVLVGVFQILQTAFSLVVFGTSPRLGSILLVDFVGKVLAATFYSLAFLVLLPWSRVSGAPAVEDSPSSNAGATPTR